MGVIGKTLKFTVGLAVGMGIGAVAALLATPISGRKVQDQIQARVKEIIDAGQKAQQERQHELQEYWEQEIDIKGQRKRDEKSK
jgi:gas vesicle protein